MKINKSQLRKLIQEVIAEVEDADAMSAGSADYKDAENDKTMQHSLAHDRKADETAVSLTLKGVNPVKVKKFLKRMAHAAKMADLEVIHAEILQGNSNKPIEIDKSKLDSLGADAEKEADVAALKASGLNIKDKSAPTTVAASTGMAAPNERMTSGKLVNILRNMATDDEKIEFFNKLTRSEKRAVVGRLSDDERLALIKPGERAGEWQAATDADVQAGRDKNKRKSAQIAAGTYNPEDTSLWNDKQWDAYSNAKAEGLPEKEAVRAAMEVDIDPSKKDEWSNTMWSYYNDAKQRGKSEQEAMAAAASVAPGSKEYKPKFKDKKTTGLGKVRLGTIVDR